mmetsp:Transcript_19787/g.48610  ORF Transcript_19787/g.48610 Transcript_19787/m.48610 type:complete len:340 (+) Transcript_19787:199-1218(+)
MSTSFDCDSSVLDASLVFLAATDSVPFIPSPTVAPDAVLFSIVANGRATGPLSVLSSGSATPPPFSTTDSALSSVLASGFASDTPPFSALAIESVTPPFTVPPEPVSFSVVGFESGPPSPIPVVCDLVGFSTLASGFVTPSPTLAPAGFPFSIRASESVAPSREARFRDSTGRLGSIFDSSIFRRFVGRDSAMLLCFRNELGLLLARNSSSKSEASLSVPHIESRLAITSSRVLISSPFLLSPFFGTLMTWQNEPFSVSTSFANPRVSCKAKSSDKTLHLVDVSVASSPIGTPNSRKVGNRCSNSSLWVSSIDGFLVSCTAILIAFPVFLRTPSALALC